MESFKTHAETSGSETLQDTVTEVQKEDTLFRIKTLGGKEFTSDYVILATGNKYRHLDVPGEKEFL